MTLDYNQELYGRCPLTLDCHHGVVLEFVGVVQELTIDSRLLSGVVLELLGSCWITPGRHPGVVSGLPMNTINKPTYIHKI